MSNFKLNRLNLSHIKQDYGWSFIFSFLVHAALFLLLFVSMQTHVKISSSALPSGDIIQASVLEEKPARAEKPEKLEKPLPDQMKPQDSVDAQKLDTQKNLEDQKKMDALKQMNQQIEAATQAAAAAQEKVKVEKLKTELQKTKEAEEAHLAELRLEKEKEKKELEALKKEKLKEEKRLAAMDEKRQEEQDRATQMRLEREKEEKKKKDKDLADMKAVKDAKRKVEEEKKLATLKAEKAAIDARVAAENAERLRFAQGEFRKYEGIIRDKVKGCWLRPSGLPAKLQCKLEISAMPDGDVVNVQIVKSSGNEAFDQSAIAAVRKAVPLPFPQGEPDVMNLFRNFTLEFIPDENSEVVNEM